MRKPTNVTEDLRTLNVAIDRSLYNRASGARAGSGLTWREVLEAALSDWLDAAPVKKGRK